MKSIIVSVYDGGEFRGQKERPVRRIPRVGYGVKLRGDVYPLGEGLRIDLQGLRYDDADCPSLKTVPPTVAALAESPPTADVHIDDSGRYRYVMVNGPEAALDSALAALDEIGLEVRSHGPSSRPANDGIKYDWYIRLAESPRSATHARSDTFTQDRGADLGARIAADLAAVDRSIHEEAVEGTDEEAEEEPEEAPVDRALTAALERELESVRAALASSEAQLNTSREEAAHWRALAERLQAAPAVRRHAAPATTEPPADDVRTSHERQLSELCAALDESERLDNSFAIERDALAVKLSELEHLRRADLERLEHLEAAHSHLAEQQAAAKSSSRRQLELVKALFDAAYPSVVLLRDSHEFLADDVTNYRAVCRKLRELCDSPRTNHPIKIQGTTHWWERRLSTGQGCENGRLYFRHRGQKVEWLLSLKVRQEQDVEWLKRNDD